MTAFDADKPINEKSQDLLGRTKFAQSVAKAIVERKNSESLVIGLYGRWGSGKTSTLNLVKEAIEENAQDDKTTPIIISFSSWGAESVAHLFSMFYIALYEMTGRTNRAKKKSKDLLKKLSEYGELLSGISTPIGTVARIARKATGKERSLFELKNEINNILKTQKRRMVVIIDDMDRLPDSQIKQVFQFVSIVADFPDVVYILPFDYEAVATALSGIQGIDGAAYMHKIIQVPLSLPDPAPRSLTRILEKELGFLLDEKRDDFSQQRLLSITETITLPHLKTLRDVRRLQNVLRFQMEILGAELNSLDILGLSSLIAFDPLLYEWIKKNKKLLKGPRYGVKSSDHAALIIDSFEKFGYPPECIDGALDALNTLFPTIKTMGPNRRETWRERRVCHEDIFDCYFAGQITPTLPERSIGDALYDGDIETLNIASNAAIEIGEFSTFLEEIVCRLNKMKTGTEGSLAKMLLSKLGQDPPFPEDGIISISCDNKICFILDHLFREAGPEESEIILLTSLKRMDINAIAAFANELNSQELAHGRLAAQAEEPDKQYLSLEGLKKVERAFLLRVNELSEDTKFASSDNLWTLIYLWQCFDFEGCKHYWNSLDEKEPLTVCFFINALAGKWNSSSGQYGYTFSEDVMEKVFPRADAIAAIDSLRSSGAFEGFDEEPLVKIIIYYENGYRSFEDRGEWTADKARSAIPSWRANFTIK